ncbi:MAG: hypothetical protein R8K47_02325 [Mariprofundaceae bacterium]
METDTSTTLVRLSERKLEQLERELATLNQEHARLSERHLASLDALLGLHERMNELHAASNAELAMLYAALDEQRAIVSRWRAELRESEKRRQDLLERLGKARRTLHLHASLHESAMKDRKRRESRREQRRLDELFAARAARPTGER